MKTNFFLGLCSCFILAALSIAHASFAQTTTEAQFHNFGLEQECRFETGEAGHTYTQTITLYSGSQIDGSTQFGLALVGGRAIEGKLFRKGAVLFTGGDESDSITLTHLEDQNSSRLQMSEPRKPNTKLVLKRTSMRGEVTQQELTGICDYILGSESIGAHN